jgi:hypothetical protein
MDSFVIRSKFLLHLLPCDHGHIDEKEHHATHHSDAGSEETQETNCSPFCVCACIKSIELSERINTHNASVPQFITTEVFAFEENLHSDFVPSFWQPPKL